MSKIALITGATAGFGTAICRTLIQAGYFVIGTGRRTERLTSLKAELGEKFIPLAFDISDRLATEEAMKSLPTQWKNIDLLVSLESADKANLDDWEQMIDTNIKGLVNITRFVLPQMVERNTGHIINLSSIAGTYPYPGGNVYGGTKAFVTQFSLNLRADLARKNIRVTSVEPGLCGGTEFSNVRFKGDDARAEKLYENVQYVTPQDIANMVLWLNQQPEHVNINRIEVMPTAQTFAPLNVARNSN